MSTVLPLADGDAARAPVAPHRLKRRFLFGYGVGQAGAQVCRDLPVFMLPPYLSLVMGVPAWMMGIAIFIPKLWVIFFDPTIGSVSDRTVSRFGRRRPWLLAAAILCPLALIALFSVPMFPQPWMRAAYACLLFTIHSTAYSLFSVPYLSLGAEASEDPHERTRLMSYRLVFLAVGMTASSGGSQALVNALGGGRDGYQMMSVLVAILCSAAMIACFLGVSGATAAYKPELKLSIREQFRLGAGTASFRLVVTTHLVQVLSTAATSTVLVLFIAFMTGRTDLLLYMSLANAVMIIVAQPFWLMVAKRIGKRRTFMAATFAMALVTFSYALIQPGAPQQLDLPLLGASSWQDVGILLRYVLLGLFMSGVTLMSLSTLTDMLHAHRIDTGVAREGAFVGMWSAVEKLGFAMGPLFAGPILSAFGFIQSTGGPVTQPPGVMTGLVLLFALIPGTLFLLSLKLIARFPDDQALPKS